MSATVSMFPKRPTEHRVLLVEDDTVLARLVKQGLTEDGYHVEVAHSFAGGYSAGDDERPSGNHP